MNNEGGIAIDPMVLQLFLQLIDEEELPKGGVPKEIIDEMLKVAGGDVSKMLVATMQSTVEATKQSLRMRLLSCVGMQRVHNSGERVQCYTWTSPEGESFTWNIAFAKIIVANRPPHPHVNAPLGMMRDALRSNPGAADINEEYAMTKDLSVPLIACVAPVLHPEHGRVLIVIDGWHRMKKAVMTNHPDPLPVHVLDDGEAAMCLIPQEQVQAMREATEKQAKG